MEFDYCNMEMIVTDNLLQIDIGCRFIDEPDELYAIQLQCKPYGVMEDIKLMFNSMDCNYRFKEDEMRAIEAYVRTSVCSSEYADWFQGCNSQ
ncbi:hypothetical protein ACFQ88_00040 [Paenibacillus sp. NPDC056579]|uniref:hypothetical protein n=1 Tax=unclassified Paenibacillus TaxID=185978 RepID=UPI001EF7A01B|nr:hypothetical protein [Paenibacillus sp. H1-7]ULL15470.1 hypothetical protein DVH26_14090 [Paenibacillus sp. H1-7]